MIDDEVLDQITQGVFQTMLEIELFRSDAEVAEESLLATIQIAGAWSGNVSLAFSADLARNAACRMLKLADDEVTATDEQEVAAELANMIGGNLKSLLPSPSQLSLPSIGTIAHSSASPPAHAITLVSGEGSLRVQVDA